MVCVRMMWVLRPANALNRQPQGVVGAAVEYKSCEVLRQSNNLAFKRQAAARVSSREAHGHRLAC